jgi:hypothetical protein
MPIGLSKAPGTLPKAAKELWVGTFNGVLENCEGTTKECDQRAARIAWNQIKEKYRKVKDQWVAKTEYEDSYHDILLTITKASLQPDGSVRWQAVASDTGRDKADERTSIDLFQDWIDRVTYKADVGYLPSPKMPFLGVSHYPALDGYGEAGITRRMYIDGNTFKADGIFMPDNPIGGKLLGAVKTELAIIKKGEQIEKPIRISAGWWDIQHLHEDSNFLFTRQSLTDKCPLCEKGQTSDKVYKAGQLDHFAATRVPMNIRTSLELKSMAKITRKEDAESIIGADEAEDLEKRARMVGKSETKDELPAGMITKADEDEPPVTTDKADTIKRGEYMRDMRRKKKLSLAEVAKRMKAKEDRLKLFEDDEEEMDFETMSNFATALKMSEEEKEDMLARFGKKRRKTPPAHKSEVDDEPIEKMGDGYHEGEMAMPMMPFGGATSIKDANAYIETKDKMNKLYSHWDVFQAVVSNIMVADEETVPNKVVAMGQAVKDLGSQIDTLKAGLSDAFLIQESTAAYEEYEDDEAADEIILEDNEVNVMSNQDHPADELKAAVDAALENKSLSREDQETAVQNAFNIYAQTVQSQLEKANPLPPAEQIEQAVKGALSDVLGPLTEQVGLLTAKMAQQEQAPVAPAEGMQQVYVPQQKSLSMPAQTPQSVQAEGNGTLPISPITGKPSQLTAVINKTVGIHN